MIDLANLDTVAGANEGFDVELRHPGSGAEIGIRIGVYGRDSDKFKAVQARQMGQRMEKVRRSGRGAAIVSPESVDEDANELLATSSFRWSSKNEQGVWEPVLLLGGERLPFTVAQAQAVYGRFVWIREQVDAAIGDRANFTKPLEAASSSLPSTNSSST